MRDDEHRDVGGGDAGEAVGEAADDGDGGVGEAGGGGEPVSRGDVERDGRGDPRRVVSDGAEDGEDEAECGDKFPRPLADAAAGFERILQDRQVEHHMHRPRAEQAADELGGDISGGEFPTKVAATDHDQRHRRIEMRAGDGGEYGDQHEQDRARRHRVGEQCHRDIAARQRLRHHARADHGGEQEERAQRLRAQPLAGRDGVSGQWSLPQLFPQDGVGLDWVRMQAVAPLPVPP